jgi:hypothetical protein
VFAYQRSRLIQRTEKGNQINETQQSRENIPGQPVFGAQECKVPLNGNKGKICCYTQTVGRGLKRFILWDYQRGVWQYDVICAVITLFIFLAPRQWFRDQPRIPQAAQITSLPGHGEAVFWIEPGLVESFPQNQQLDQVGRRLSVRTGKIQRLTRIEPIYDSEQEIKGYMAFAQP